MGIIRLFYFEELLIHFTELALFNLLGIIPITNSIEHNITIKILQNKTSISYMTHKIQQQIEYIVLTQQFKIYLDNIQQYLFHIINHN